MVVVCVMRAFEPAKIEAYDEPVPRDEHCNASGESNVMPAIVKGYDG